MATPCLLFILLCCNVLVNGEVNNENVPNSLQDHRAEIATVLNHLNSTPVKVYNYKEGTLINAHTKADITELTLDISVDCINNYPELPCTEKILICNAFVQNSAEGGSRVLNDVKCVPKPEIIIEEAPSVSSTEPTTTGQPNEIKTIALSNEAVSSEVGEHFVAVRRDSVPCTGCPFDLNPNAEGVDELVDIALKHLESEKAKKHALIKVLRLQQQVVSGVKLILTAEIAPTVCSKEAQEGPCPLDSDAESTICEITFLHKPWISKVKHVIKNNCTVSQEYVTPDSRKDDLNNEIDINAGRTRPAAFADNPNFDHIAENGAAEDMTPSRLEDLESQILIESDDTITHPQQVQATVQSEISAMENQPLEDRPNICNTEKARIEPSPSSTVIYSETTPIQEISSTLAASSEEDVSKSKRSNSEENSEEESSVEKLRMRRAIPQLEKISPEEKGLVKNLADFAAASLDSIDDDNHKRIILQILGAKKMVGDDGVYYRLIMRMGISQCLEDRPPEPNVNCREKLFENYTKICKVQVYVNDDIASPKVVKSQCQNIKRDKDNNSNRTNYSRFKRSGIPGGPIEISKDDAKVQELVTQGITHLNSQLNKNYKPVEVLSATSQVVAGSLYKIKTKVSHPEGGPSTVCDIKVWEKIWENFKQFTVKCENGDQLLNYNPSARRKRSLGDASELNSFSGQHLGAEVEVSKEDEFVGKYLEGALSHMDADSGHENKLKIHKIISVSKQIVAGQIYSIKAQVVVSDCKKIEAKNRNECEKLEGVEPKTCEFVIYERLWVPNSRQTNVTCEDSDKVYTYSENQRPKRSIDVEESSSKKPRKGLLGEDDIHAHYVMFNEFVKKYNKVYPSKKEYKYRLKVFSDNMDYVRMLNTYEQGTAAYGVTQFADLTRQEFSKSLGLRPDLRNDENEAPFAQASIPDIELPTEFDWRKKGAVTEVKNQQQCGSCWAFSVTGNVEGQYAIKHGKLMEFSEQELVDCDTVDQGCNGGLMDTAYRQIEKLGGLETEQDYPYDAEDEKCHFNRSLARVQLTGALNISHNETDMAKWLVANGPISIAINANAMQFYMGGVSHPFKFLCSPKNLDHGVLIVGYGVHTYPLFNKTLPYWIVKNSWGKSWGEQGYYRVYRGDGTCGLNQTPSSAIVA